MGTAGVSRGHGAARADPAAMTARPRPVTIEQVGADVWLLRVGDTTIALSQMELAALRVEAVEACDT